MLLNVVGACRGEHPLYQLILQHPIVKVEREGMYLYYHRDYNVKSYTLIL